MIAVLSRGIARIPHLDRFLGEPVVRVRPWWPWPPEVTAVAGWGRRPGGTRARRHAVARGLPYLALEDGFLRSVGLGKGTPPLSLVVDDLGIYYDASRPSRLEALTATDLSASQRRRARALIPAWCAARVSKYNHLREFRGPLPRPCVLVVDQTWGDASIVHGRADRACFQRMLEAALDENPGHTVLVKIHPDVWAGHRRGHFEPRRLRAWKRVAVLAEDVHPVRLLDEVEAVYTVTSQMGFEALLRGRRVRTFGMPFYAGWGLTTDDLPAPGRRRPVDLEALVHAALVAYPRYLDPETGTLCEVEDLVRWMGRQRRLRERFPAEICAQGFSRQKRPVVRSFLQGSRVYFKSGGCPGRTPVAVWGMRPVESGEAAPVLRLEDGFLRSVGLGAEWVRPQSWVIDERGLYYDATQPSRLEELLQGETFDAALTARAAALRRAIVAAGLTKYNLAGRAWTRPHGAGTVILVPGQVETDASIRYGCGEIRTNLDLLRAVRQRRREAWLVYKPHPDVVAGLRRRGRGEKEAPLWCDEVVRDVPMADLLNQVDEVHTLTSLSGFEALLRGRPVTCYGRPFYAGWGLTEDLLPLERRTRRLSLDELVAGALILYPLYVSRVTGHYTTPERVLEELAAQRSRFRPSLWRTGWRLLLRLGAR